MEFTIKARLRLDSTGLRAHFDNDFVNYYLKLITLSFYKTRTFFTPRHGAHVSVVINSVSGHRFSHDALKHLNNRVVEIKYDPENIRQGGSTKKFTNFYMPVISEDIQQIRSSLGIRDNSFLHITICNDKNNL